MKIAGTDPPAPACPSGSIRATGQDSCPSAVGHVWWPVETGCRAVAVGILESVPVRNQVCAACEICIASAPYRLSTDERLRSTGVCEEVAGIVVGAIRLSGLAHPGPQIEGKPAIARFHFPA